MAQFGALGVGAFAAGAGEHLAHPPNVEPWQSKAFDARLAPQIGEHLGERVGPVQLGVPVRADHKQPHRLGGAHQVT